MGRKIRKLAVLAKVHSAYNTDPVPTAGANAMLMTEVDLQPLAGEEVSRDLLLPYLGHQGVELTGDYVRLEGSVEIAGAGGAGDVPAFGALLRGCGLAETVNAGTSVVYEPVSAGEEAVAIYYYLDGVRHIILGARGNVTMSFVPKQIPRFRFTFMGLVGTISDTALPAADVSAFVRPVSVSKAQTTLELHSVSALISESVEVNLGNAIEMRHLIGSESAEMTDRQSTGTAVLEAPLLASKNWFAAAQARTRDALQLVHGTTAGNIVQLDAPKVEIGRPTQGSSQGIANLSLPLMLTPDSGDDELSITVK
ncbi:phage tail tube protein [Oricola indica]|uniref:phage tail tube protein n=1 Tax=Oricola indica TaxID=2872591 RepID=UPI003CCB9222